MIEQIPTGEVHPHPDNSRTHTDEQITALGRSLERWGWTQPIVVDEGNTVLVGHGRLRAAQELGFSTVDVIRQTGLSDPEKRAMIISDNKLAEDGSTWDKDVLDDELRSLVGSDFDISLTGWELPEFSLKDVIAKEPEENPLPAWGTLWHLDRHTLYVGDCTVHHDLQKARLTDLPFSVGYVDEIQTVSEVLSALFDAVACPVLYCHVSGPGGMTGLFAAFEASKYDARAQIALKHHGKGAGKPYRKAGSPVFYAVRRGKKANWNGGRKQNTVWSLASSGDRSHFARIIKNHSTPGDNVALPNVSDARAILAAHETQRTATAMCADQGDARKILDEWNKATGVEATSEADL